MLKRNPSPLIRSLTAAFITTATLSLLSGHAVAADPMPAAANTEAKGFLAFDKNQDGVVDAKEAGANLILKDRFDAVDTDKDGRLSMEEFNKGFATR